MIARARMAQAVVLAAACAPALAHRPPPPPATPICIDLANNPTWGLAGNPAVTGLTAVITPATATNAAYCQVDFTDVSLEGLFWGYPHGQTSKYRTVTNPIPNPNAPPATVEAPPSEAGAAFGLNPDGTINVNHDIGGVPLPHR